MEPGVPDIEDRPAGRKAPGIPRKALHGHCGPAVDIGVVTVLELIDRIRATHSAAQAIRERDRAVTYAELHHLGDVAAATIGREYGIGRGDTVAIAAPAGIGFTAAVLGTLRAGAAYLPVDTTYPKQRIEQIFRASSARLIVFTEERDAEAYAKSGVMRPGTDVTFLGQVLEENAGPEPPLRQPIIDPGDSAYVIFSSGSTGAPKGIVQTHRCLANLVAWQVGGAGLGSNRRILQSAPVSFDVSVQEIFYSLASGGCLYVPDPDVKRDPRELIDYIIDQGIEVTDFPQSLIDAIMSLPRNFRHASALRHLISAGETVRITPELEALLCERPELTLHNHYGPAENHMVAAHSMSSGRGNLEPLPPVGSLIWNTYIYILDECQLPVADGEIGEVYIGGVGLARGYTDPSLTEALFVPDPFRPGARAYRTRDRGSWRPDGTLKLLGRIDDLIKIRGNSVEPREVEAHLGRSPRVRDAAVFGVVRADGTAELHAVLTGMPPAAPELRRALLAALPGYMVPVRWWLADALPLSPNGKLDRKALPGPAARPLPMVPHQSNSSR